MRKIAVLSMSHDRNQSYNHMDLNVFAESVEWNKILM